MRRSSALDNQSAIFKKPEGIPAPLSLAQRRLWFLYTLNPSSAVYNISRAWRLRGGLNISALDGALRTILDRQEALRTVFQEVDGQVVQVIKPTPQNLLTTEDMSSLSQIELEKLFDAFHDAETRKPFDLRQGPPVRFFLLTCGRDDYIFLMVVHHIVFDGWSLQKFVQELNCAYKQNLENGSRAIPPLPIQYTDFSYWQTQECTQEHFSADLAYWKSHLEGAPHFLELPTDCSRGESEKEQDGYHQFFIPARTLSKLKQVSRREGVTLFMTLLGAFQILLAFYSGQKDIVVGTPTANRNRVEFEDLLGFFVNLIPIRLNLSTTKSFNDVLAQVRRVCLEGYRHSEIPFEYLVELLNPPRDVNRHPVVQVLFQLRNSEDRRLEFPGLSASPFSVTRRTGNFDLHVVCEEKDSLLEGFVYYPRHRFSDTFMVRLASCYQRLLEDLAAEPERHIFSLSLTTEAERRQQLTDWNNTIVAFSQAHATLTTLIETQAAKTPLALAVVAQGQHLTYSELEGRANQLARHLLGHGVGRGDFVGIFAERSLEMVVALYATLKAGAAYVPIDPSYPGERVTFMLDDARVPVVLTQEHLRLRLPRFQGQIILVDRDKSGLDLMPRTPPPRHEHGDDLAYMIYTSGSTGQPKGAMNTHRGICNRLLWMQAAYNLEPDDRVLQKTPFSFDVSVWEFFWPLITGAGLVLAKPDGHRDSLYLRNLILQENISTVHFVPSMLHSFLQESGIEDCAAVLRRVISSGETLSEDIQARFFNRLPGVALNNLYGPTEAAVDVTAWHCQPFPTEARVPIGRPIANIQIYLLNNHQRLLPCGLPGELHIGGVGLARGYHRRPGLTADKFIPDFLSGVSGARIYQSGDLARYRADGVLEYLGRKDYQIKLRGFRIEPGEIESQLVQHQEVEKAIVLCAGERLGEQVLIAYVVPRQASIDLPAIRAYLQARLPHYMIPGTFVQLEDIPLTANGKIDRRALPKPDDSDKQVPTAFAPPRNPDEEHLAGIWEKVLHVSRVGIHDNFFSLGGHSLYATQIISRIKSECSVELPVSALFAFPTVAGLAEEMRKTPSDSPDKSANRSAPVSRPHNLPLSLTQERFWILDQIPHQRRGYAVSKMFRLKGDLHVPALRQSFQHIVVRHEILRTTFPVIDGSPQQVISESETFDIPLVDLSQLTDEEKENSINRLLEEEEMQPFNLARGPLFRIKLFRLSSEEHLLVVMLHHIICDARSLEILNEELSTLYHAFSEGKKPSLPALSSQYSDFTVWQHQSLNTPEGVQSLAYWKTTLENPPPPLPLPTDYPRSQIPTLEGHRLEYWLTKEQTGHLLRLKKRSGTTFFMILLAALQLLISRITGTTDILIGAPVAGRNHAAFEPLIGCFLNNLVLRTIIRESSTFTQLLGQVREKVLGAILHQDVPFEKLLEVVPHARHAGRTPLFQVLLNMHDFSDKDLSLPGMHARFVPSPTVKSLFDWTLYFQEHPDGIHLKLVYNAGLFSQPRMKEILNQLIGLLEQVADDPDLPLHRYSLITHVSKKYLPDPTILLETPQQETVPTLICRQAEAFPDHIAIRQGKQIWTYKELVDQTLSLTSALHKDGLRPGEVVAIGGYPSIGLVVVLFAVLQAGGVIMPMDPHIPIHRQRVMLREADARRYVWIGHDPAPDISGDGVEEIALHCIDSETARPTAPGLSEWSGRQGNPLPRYPRPHDPAYIFFTSGTTGNPKGIRGQHQSLSHFLKWQAETFTIGHGDRVAQLTALSFDAVLRDIFLPLVSGATLCLPENQLELLPDQVIFWLAQEGITVLHTVPTVARFWIRHIPEGISLSRLRWVFFSGEPVSDELVNHWRRAFPESGQLVNFYGPTETTLIKTWQIISDPPSPGIQPVGFPMPQTQILILRSHNQLCGTGEIGEIVIRTSFGTHGYINSPGGKQEGFFKNPYWQHSADQWYRTGDYGRYRLDGSVDILGRLDNQIKIRGVRIEPEELTSHLEKHQDLAAATVLGHVEEGKDNFLAAYVVPKTRTSPTEQSLRSFLASRVPAAMVPSFFIFLESLPVSHNGKLDRRALPVPALGSAARSPACIEPCTAVESRLSTILRELLSIDQIGIDDNFFELGGHSLLAMQLINRIETVFHIPFPLRHIFECPTIRQWAGLLEAESQNTRPVPAEAPSFKDPEEGFI